MPGDSPQEIRNQQCDLHSKHVAHSRLPAVGGQHEKRHCGRRKCLVRVCLLVVVVVVHVGCVFCKYFGVFDAFDVFDGTWEVLLAVLEGT